MEKLQIRELVNLLEQELIRVGYKEATLNYYRNNWKRIIAHFDERSESFFSEAVAMQYVDAKCDFFVKEKAGLLTQSNIYLFRIVRMMGDFQQHGTVLHRYHRSLSKINSPDNLAILNRFQKHCQSCGYAVSIQKSYCRTAENFVCFIEAHGLRFENLNAENLTAFVNKLMGYSYKMVDFVLCGTRCFLRFLHDEKVIAADLPQSIPCMQSCKQTRVPSVWKKDDLLRLLEAIDRGNPSGN